MSETFRVGRPRFGDIIENGWASERNPTRVGYFVRAGNRTGKLNRGPYYEVTDGKGKFWELPLGRDHKITVRAGLPAAARAFLTAHDAVFEADTAGAWDPVAAQPLYDAEKAALDELRAALIEADAFSDLLKIKGGVNA